MKELNDKIITWLKEKGIDKLSPDKQYLKIIEEVGELASGLLKSDLEAIKDAIGDIYVAVIGLALQLNINIINVDDVPTLISGNNHVLEQIVEHTLIYVSFDDITLVLRLLKGFAFTNGLLFKECVEHAYNEIKDREIKIVNGVAVK